MCTALFAGRRKKELGLANRHDPRRAASALPKFVIPGVRFPEAGDAPESGGRWSHDAATFVRPFAHGGLHGRVRSTLGPREHPGKSSAEKNAAEKQQHEL